MEVSIVRQRVRQLIEWSKRPAADRREARRLQTDEATREYDAFLERIAVPLFKQVANILRSEGLSFEVFTPGRSVRLMGPRGNDNYIELTLDTQGAAPKLIGHARRSRGGDVAERELVLNATANIGALTEEDLLGFLLSELEPFFES